MRMTVGVLIVLAVMPIAAYAQLSSAEYTINTGEMVLDFDVRYDLGTVMYDRIQITDGTDTIILGISDVISERGDSIRLNMDSLKAALVNNMSSPILKMDEGAVRFGGAHSAVQSVPIIGKVQVGVVIPDTYQASRHMVELSTEHFNHILERSDASWRLEVVFNDNERQTVSLLELEQSDIDVVIGNESLLAKSRIAQPGMIVMACCDASTDYDIVRGDPLFFSLVPSNNDALDATLAMMNDVGINRILPVYPANDRAILDRINYQAQVAVADGIQYGFSDSSEQIVSSVADAIASDLVMLPGVRLGVLLTSAHDTPRILEAAYQDRSLTTVRWFGLETHDGILDSSKAKFFAQEVGYMVPYIGVLENPLTVSLDSYMYGELGYAPNKTAFGAYDAVQILGLSILGDADIYNSDIDKFADLNVEANDVAGVISGISSEFGGYTTYVGLAEDGGLEAPVYQIQSVRGDAWVRTAMYNNPVDTKVGTISFGDAILPYIQYVAGEPLIDDVVQVGLLVHEYDAYEAGLAARMGLALLDGEYSLVVEDVTNNDIQDGMRLFSDVGIPIVVVHAPESSTLEASVHAQNHNTLIIGTASTGVQSAIQNDNTFRMLPSDMWQARALAGMMAHDNIRGVVAIYPDQTQAQSLLEGVADVFAGEIDMTHSYTDISNVMRNVTLSAIEMTERYGHEGTAILALGDGDDVGYLMDNALGTAGRINWYGSLRVAGSPSISDMTTGSINLAALSPTISGGGHAQLILDSLYLMQPPAYTNSLFEAARVAGMAMTQSDSNADIARALLPSIADDSNLMYDDISFDENGDLASYTYDIWRIDDAWIRDSIYDVMTGYASHIPIGVMVPLTGHDAQRGIQQMWGAHLALSAQNEILEQEGAPWRLSQRVVDTASSPIVSLGAARDLYNMNIQAALGPPDTVSVNEIGRFGSYSDFMLISCCSDAPDVYNSYVVYLGSTDVHKSQTILRMLGDDGISNLLVIHDGSSTILNSLASDFSGHLNVQEYDAIDAHSRVVADADDTLSGMLNLYDRSSVGVLLLADHTDTASILGEALYQNNLQYANWYGVSTDGVLPDILYNPDAVATATNTNFAVAVPAIPKDVDELKAILRMVIGFTPSSDAYLMHDAATLLSTTIIQLNGDSTAPAVAEIMPLLAADLAGITGPLALENNQRLTLSHDIWRIVDGKWQLQKTIP
ncbi:MAG: ABC transporter substrate-binding protein [Cenarchaeum sp. SB0678_bin_8]|nr:ABC transporter substrate-binding protein [Cenarchaeum sp. SB0666_bin_15]MYD58377.1 ABC transporter substrate-binding protein [Cenarchaeum sp. SB0678_bin_8]